MAEVSVSVLDVEEENAINVFYNIETAKIDYFHIDVMDGEFVKKDNVFKFVGEETIMSSSKKRILYLSLICNSLISLQLEPILIIQPLDENPYFFMQYNGEMPFLTFITITGNPSIISSSVFTLSIAFGSI